MPDYEYYCEDGHAYVETRSMSEEQRVAVCPVEGCGKPLKRNWGNSPSAIFKGTGFYSTDKNTGLLKPGQQVDY